MAYSINPNLPKARAFAMELLIKEQLPLAVVAIKCVVHRSTVWRWRQKWQLLNRNVQLTNSNRPNRIAGSQFRIAACTWRVPTASSRPLTNPGALSQWIVARILELKVQLKRCAEVIWHYLVYRDGIRVSLSNGVVAFCDDTIALTEPERTEFDQIIQDGQSQHTLEN